MAGEYKFNKLQLKARTAAPKPPEQTAPADPPPKPGTQPEPAAIPASLYPAPLAPTTLEFRTKVEAVLANKVQEELQSHWLATWLLGAAAVGVVFFTFWFIYLFWSAALGTFMESRHWFRMALSAAAVMALFYLHFRRRRTYSTELTIPLKGGTAPLDIYLPVQFGQVLMSPEYFAPPAFIGPLKYLALGLFLGPHVAATAQYAHRCRPRLQAVDVSACADIVVLLMGFNKRVPLAEIVEAFPQLEPPVILRQLARLSGILFIQGETPALTLSEDLRRELQAAMGAT
ncbi:MAG: hypothetical protein WCO56_05195 [Verrucomicrobiota bacterium]